MIKLIIDYFFFQKKPSRCEGLFERKNNGKGFE